MKIVLVSDTHNQISKIKLPDADLLIHAGDFSMKGDYVDFIKFNNDLDTIAPLYKYGVVGIFGNHELFSESHFDLAKAVIGNMKLLHDSEIVINNIKLWGSPHQPVFYNWAWNLPRGEQIKKKWDLIPDDIDILITHGPPMGILDRTISNKYGPAQNVGCEELIKRVEKIAPKLHVFGHIHSSYGMIQKDKTIYLNASTCNEKYRPINPPFIVEIDDITKNILDVKQYL